MTKLAYLLVGSAAVALAACSSGNEDAVSNAELNQPAVEMNDVDAAAEAANAEAEALGNQAQQLEQENAVENTENPTDEQEQNVSGM